MKNDDLFFRDYCIFGTKKTVDKKITVFLGQKKVFLRQKKLKGQKKVDKKKLKKVDKLTLAPGLPFVRLSLVIYSSFNPG